MGTISNSLGRSPSFHFSNGGSIPRFHFFFPPGKGPASRLPLLFINPLFPGQGSRFFFSFFDKKNTVAGSIAKCFTLPFPSNLSGSYFFK